MDTDYLQRVVGESLRKCLAEVAEKRPFDPIEYIAHWLYNYTVNVKYEEEKTAEAKQVEQAKSDFELEKKKRDQMKEEAVRFAEIAAERKRQEEEQQKKEAQAALASKLAPVEEREEPPEDIVKIVEVTVESVPPSEAVAAEGDVVAESGVAASDIETPGGEGAGTAEVTEEETAAAADEGGTGEEAGEATED